MRKGDVEKGFAEAEWIIEREYTNPSVQHVPMETHVAIVEWKVGDEVTIWSSAQSPFTVRNLFCHAFKLPLNKVRVVVPHVGGGFGGKAGIHLEPLVACLSRKAGGRPVKFWATREEEFSLLPCRSALTYRIKTGVRSDGKITAQQMTMYWDAGAYADYAVNVTRASGYSARVRTRSPTPGSTRTRSTPTSLTAPPIAGSATSSSSGASSVTWNSWRARSAWIRSSSGGRTCCARARPR